MFQQNRAPSPTSRVIQDHLLEATPEFIKKDEWPPQSPDCNLMDYAILDYLKENVKENVYQGVRDKVTKQALNDRIITSISLEQISVSEILKSISTWKKWFRLVIALIHQY